MKDLLVVGAGPAGSHLAGKFASQGRDVLVVERSDEVGKPLACSGHVSPDIWSFVPEEKREELEQNKIRGARFHPDKNSEYRFFKKETVSYAIDRVKFDRVKAEEAEKAGAEINTGETVKEVNEKEDFVEVVTDKDTYEARMVAGCDGAQSKTREEVGLPEPDHFYQGVLCFSDEEDGSDFVDVFLEVPKFFGWRIPRGDSVEYGAAVPRGEEPMKWLDQVTEGFIEEEDRRDVCAGAIPIGPVEKSVSERVFLVGDAAGQTKPFTGGGILYGMRAAEVAAEAIDVEDESTLEKYEEAWREELGKDIRMGKLIEKSYSFPKPVQKLGMWFFQGEIGVHMDRPTSLFSLNQLKKMVPGADRS